MEPTERKVFACCALVMTILVIPSCASSDVECSQSAQEAPKTYRGIIGADSPKIKQEGDKTFVWAGGGRPGSAEAAWYEFTDALIPAGDLQFGIGKDRIRSIDDPLFVQPDDPRLLALLKSPHGYGRKPKTIDELVVIGYATGDVVRAYPLALLDRHELVNDSIGGKPVAVGW